jgi:hypothetical protein
MIKDTMKLGVGWRFMMARFSWVVTSDLVMGRIRTPAAQCLGDGCSARLDNDSVPGRLTAKPTWRPQPGVTFARLSEPHSAKTGKPARRC